MSESECEDGAGIEDVIYIAQHILAGVEKDVKILLSRVTSAFDTYEELRFHHFVQVWKEMRFDQIYRGRLGYRDTHEFTEGLLAVVKSEILSLENSLGYRSAGIYALYSLFFKQPPHVRAHVRLTLPEIVAMRKTLQSLSEGQHWDILHCVARLAEASAFHFTAGNEVHSLDAISSFYSSSNASSQREEGVPGSNPFKSRDFQSHLSDLDCLQKKYVSMKEALSSPEDPSLSFVKGGFEDKINSVIASAFDEKNDSAKDDEIGDRRKRLVDKYFSNAGLGYRQKELENFKHSNQE